jgi:hypothetical protein
MCAIAAEPAQAAVWTRAGQASRAGAAA